MNGEYKSMNEMIEHTNQLKTMFQDKAEIAKALNKQYESKSNFINSWIKHIEKQGPN